MTAIPRDPISASHKPVKVLFSLSETELNAVIKWRDTQNLPSVSAAFRDLLRLALEHGPDEAPPPSHAPDS